MNLEPIRQFVYRLHINDQTGHDILHLNRVEANALEILKEEGEARKGLTLAIVLLHEVFDDKMNMGVEREDMTRIFKEAGIDREGAANIIHSIRHLSFSANIETKHDLSLEGQIVQDADRLDAMGAIGIARAFYYGGHQGQPLYSSNQTPRVLTSESYRKESSCLNHFYEKLLTLKDTMNTAKGQQLAEGRHEFMVTFLQEFERDI